MVGGADGRHARPSERAGFTWALGALVAIVHIGAAVMLHRSIGALYEDGGEFNGLAAGLARELSYGPPEAFRPPGWPILLAVPYRAFGVHPNLGLALSAILAGLAVVALVRLGQRLGLTRFQSRVAGLAYGLFPWVLMIGAALYAEPLFNLLTICLCLMIVAFCQRRPIPWWWVAPGVIAAYATLVRPVLAFWLPVGLLFALGRKLDWRAALAMALGIAIILGPWTWRNFERLDTFVPLTTAGGLTLALANNDLAGAAQAREGLPPVPDSEVEGDRAYRKFAQDWIQEHPGEFAKRVPERIVRTFDPVTRLNKGVFAPLPIRWAVRVLWIAVLAVVGLGFVKHHRGRWLVPLSLAVLLTLPVVLFGGGFRFLIPALPFMALWGVAGASLIWQRRRPPVVTAG
jgi:hypothetical protein